MWAAQVAAMRAALWSAGVREKVDAVFSGDDYCAELERWFNAVAVQTSRSGGSTSVRRNLAGSWDELAPATRAGLTTRVVVLGAESTGRQRWPRSWPGTSVSEAGCGRRRSAWRSSAGSTRR